MEEGAKLFGVSGTPGTVLLNTESGEWVLISGAYPYEAFEAEIKKLLGK
jgi:protein-disulfide isomerase